MATTRDFALLPRRDGRLQWGRVLLLVALGGVILLSTFRPYLLLSGRVPHPQASMLRQSAYAALTVLGLMGAIVDRRFDRLIPLPWPIIAMLAWSWLSLGWTANFSATLANLGLTSIVIWLLFLTVDRLGARRALAVTGVCLLSGLIANGIAVAFDPALGIQGYGLNGIVDQWRGVMGHKNIAGAFAALTMLVFALPGGGKGWARYVVAAAAAAFVLMSASRTSITGGIAALLIGAFVWRFARMLGEALAGPWGQRLRLGAIIFAVMVLLALVFLTFDIDLLIGQTGNSAIMSRSQIWQSMLLAYQHHPVIGVGFGAYWTPTDTAALADSSPFAQISQGHNGYLDLALQAGLIGLLLALGATVVWPARLIARLLLINPAVSAMSAALMSFVLIDNFTESSLFDEDQIQQTLAMLALAMLAATARRMRQNQTAPTLSEGAGLAMPTRRKRRSRGSGTGTESRS